MTGSAFEALVDILATSKSMRDKFKADHAPDATGRCRTCRAGSDGAGRVLRCTSWLAVEAAVQRVQER